MASTLVNALKKKPNVRILKAALLVGVFASAGKIIAALKEVVVAHKFGLSPDLDVYLLVFSAAMWIPGIWMSVLQSSLIPLLAGSKRSTSLVEFLRQFYAASILIAILCILTTPLLALLLSDSSNYAKGNILQVCLILAPISGAGILIALLSAQLMSQGRHVNTLFEVIPSLVIILILLIPFWTQQSEALSIGTLLGAFGQLIALYWALRLAGEQTKPSFQFNFHLDQWKTIITALGTLTIAHTVMSFNEPISIFFAARLGEGNVAGLGYANRILMLFLTLGAISISRSILPVLSEREIDRQQKFNLTYFWSLTLLALGCIATLVGWFIAPFMVEILYERGEFSNADSLVVSKAVEYGMLQIPFYFCGIVMVQLCATISLYRAILASACIAISVKLLVSLALYEKMGIEGLTLANTPMYMATCLFFFFYLRMKRKEILKNEA